MNLRNLQTEVYEWQNRNFPAAEAIHLFLGVVEEVGELAHAILKLKQGIRGDNHEAEAKDAVGDIMIFLMNYCSRNDWWLDDILAETWEEVRKRDWLANPEDGIGDSK